MASGFCPFDDATGLEESGGRAVASVKGCFFMFFVFVPPSIFPLSLDLIYQQTKELREQKK